MTSKQFQKLIKDKDLSQAFSNEEEAYKAFEKMNDDFSHDYFASSEGKIHFLSRDLRDIVNQSYSSHLIDLYCFDQVEQDFKLVVNDRLRYWPVSKEKRVGLLEKIIEEKCIEKEAIKLNREDDLFDFNDSYTNTTFNIYKDAEQRWFRYFFCDDLTMLEFLKFEIFKGSKIALDEENKIGSIAEALGKFDDVLKVVFENVVLLRKITYLHRRICEINPSYHTELKNFSFKKEKVANNEVIGIFCRLISETGKLNKGINEDQTSYCRRVCDEYNFDYSDKIRQSFSRCGNYIKIPSKDIEKLRDVILEKIDSETRESIESIINKKNALSLKMYG